MTRLLSLGLLVTLFFQCTNSSKNSASENTKKGIDQSSMDLSIDPTDDFYQYACGAWLKNNPVPETEGKWTSFNTVIDKNNAILKEVLTSCATKSASSSQGSNVQKIGDFYNLAMDTSKLDAEGITPIQPLLNSISNIQTPEELSRVVCQLHKKGIPSLFDYYVMQDLKMNDQYVGYISQGGLGLPDRDFYFKEDENSVETREKYKLYINKLMELAGMKDNYSDAILEIETALADASMTNVELRNYEAQYNKMSISDLDQLSPQFNWSNYFDEAGVKADSIVVGQPKFITKINQLTTSVSLENWKKYLNWTILNTTASFLNSEIEKESFNFYQTELKGIQKMKPRWKRVLEIMNGGMGEILGQEYVKVAFSQEAKEKVNELVDNFLLAYEERIKNLDWMSDSTKNQAIMKLSTFTKKLGYPDKWKDYSALSIEKDSYVNNFLRINEFAFNDMIKDLGKPIDKTRWGMPPQKVNAYYNPIMNEIVFPAAILQPPFMDIEADDAVLYGTIGAVIGHEITHGFDDQGSGFDHEGNLKNWWQESDLNNFKKKAKKIVEHFNKYEPLDGLNVNGELTLGENIADFGGLTVSYYAYQKSLEGKERVDIDGFTPEQRFFIAYGQVWKGNFKDEAMRQQLLTNPHAPGQYRVLGTLSMMPEFYEAFNCQPDNKMYTADSLRTMIW